MTILIHSVERDLHARAIKWTLDRNEIPSTILCTSKLPSSQGVTINFTLRDCSVVQSHSQLSEHTIPEPNEISLVWGRRYISDEIDVSDVHPDDESVVKDETGALIENIWAFIEMNAKTATFANRRDMATKSRDKLVQLQLARETGLTVPETIMSNTPEMIRDFYKYCGGSVVVKPFYQSAWQTGDTYKWQGACALEEDHLKQDGPLRLCPAIYQKRITKLYELRVLIAGEKMVAVKLNSQNSRYTSVDWRHDAYVQTMKFEPYTLTNDITSKLRLFMSKMGLLCGSIDMIMSPDFGYVFLEVNDQGQFLFLERQCREINIMSEFAEFLSESAGYGRLTHRPKYEDYLESEDYSLLIRERADNEK